MALALVGAFLIAVDQHHVDAGARRDVADAGAHEAGADHRELLDLGRRHVWRTPRALVQFLHRQEQAADHRRRLLTAQDLREVARFDAQRRVDRQLQAFIDALHDGARRRIIVVGLAAVDRIAGREHLHAGLGIDRAAGELETLLVPGRNGLAAALDPVLCRLDKIAARNNRVDQIQRLGLGEVDRLALEQQLHGILRRDDARHALGAAGAGEQTDLHFGQPEPGLGIVRGDPVMAGQRQFEATTERKPVDRGDPWPAAGLDRAKHLREPAALVEQHLVGGLVAFGFQRIGILTAHAFEHRQIGAGAQCFLAGGDDDALHGAVGRSLFHDLLEFVDRGLVEHVHRTARGVPRHQRNAVGVGLDFEILEGHLLLPVSPSS